MAEANHNEERRTLLYQQLFDLHKHLTTINTGSLVLLAAVLKDLFDNPVKTYLVQLTFICLMVSLGTCLICMYMIVFVQHFEPKPSKRFSLPHFLSGIISGISLSMFFGAMITFTRFFVVNFNR